MSKVSDLRWYYTHRALGAHGGTPATFIPTGVNKRTFICLDLGEVDDYWIGAIVWFTGGPLYNQFASVADYDAASHMVTLDADLPTIPSPDSDLFMLFLGGRFISDQPIAAFAANVGWAIPGLLQNPLPSPLNGEGTGTVWFKLIDAIPYLGWQPPGAAGYDLVDVSAAGAGDLIELLGPAAEDAQSKFLLVQRAADPLPLADAAYDLPLVLVDSFYPPRTGAELAAGFTVYRPLGLQNDGTTPVYALAAYLTAPAGAPTTIAAGGGITAGGGVLTGTSFAGWPTSGFVFNATKNDLRYYQSRSGNQITCADPAGGIRDFTAQTWDPADAIQPYPWCDVGLDPELFDVFANPDSETEAPANVTFSAPQTAGTGIALGDVAADAHACLWLRFYLPAGADPVDRQPQLVALYAETTE